MDQFGIPILVKIIEFARPFEGKALKRFSCLDMNQNFKDIETTATHANMSVAFYESVVLLIAKEVDLKLEDSEGLASLKAAKKWGNKKIMDLLIKRRIKI